MALYSLHGDRPAPLPFRIRLPGGFTRTDPSTFTEDEIAAAGFTGPFIEPEHDPATQELQWDGAAFVVTEKPPEPPSPDYYAFWDALLVSPVYQSIRAQALTTPAVLVACTEFIAALGDAKAGRPNQAAIQACINYLLAAATLNATELAELGALLAAGGLDAVYTLSALPQAEFIGQEWTAPDGTIWRVVQARGDDGQFLPDDPATPDRESLEWVPVP